MSSLAWHTLIDFHDCALERMHDHDGLRATLIAAIQSAGGTYVTDVFHQFSPHGLSGMVVIAESHVAIHTWPEHQFTAMDIFSCTPALDQQAIIDALSAWFKTESQSVDQHERGRHLAAVVA